MDPVQHTLFPSPPAAEPRPREVRTVSRPLPLPRRQRQALWLAIHFNALAIDILQRETGDVGPCAIIESDHGIPRISAVNDAAAERGIHSGLTLAAAWSLHASLAVHERDPDKEADVLHRLAIRAGRFTPNVVIDGESLLLDIRASLSLFGGLESLRDSVIDDFEATGFSFRTVIAPTPRAAHWFACAGREVCVDNRDSLRSALGELPLAATGWNSALLEKFHGIGARCLRDLLRLPRDGVARRYGERILQMLDQATGAAPDIRDFIKPPKKFSAKCDILYETTDLARLQYPLTQLLSELDDYLRSTQQGANRLQLHLQHREQEDTCITVGFATRTRDARRIRELVEQRLANITLPAAVTGISVTARELAPLTGSSRALFTEHRNDDVGRLVEHLVARLGAESVTSLRERADHRPEQAWKLATPGTRNRQTGRQQRPEWLFAQPEPLNGNPLKDARFRVIQGPERIETGWWDDDGVARDYFVAVDATGRCLWIYRDRKNGSWWIQGLFA